MAVVTDGRLCRAGSRCVLSEVFPTSRKCLCLVGRNLA